MKKTIIKFVFLLVCLTGVSLAYSQENFVAGSIIKLNGDTVKGYVDYRNWERNPNQIKFKERESAEKTGPVGDRLGCPAIRYRDSCMTSLSLTGSLRTVHSMPSNSA